MYKGQPQMRRHIREKIERLQNILNEKETDLQENLKKMSCAETEKAVSEIGCLSYKIETLRNDLRMLQLRKTSIH